MHAECLPQRRGGGDAVDLRASCCCLLGQAFHKQEKNEQAVLWLGYALRIDVYCFEAFDYLIKQRLLSKSQEHLLVTDLPWNPAQVACIFRI